MKNMTTKEFLNDFDGEEVIELVNECKSWKHLFFKISLLAIEEDDSYYTDSIEVMTEYFKNELIYFINDDEYSLNELVEAVNFFNNNTPAWIKEDLASDIETAKQCIVESREGNDRMMGLR